MPNRYPLPADAHQLPNSSIPHSPTVAPLPLWYLQSLAGSAPARYPPHDKHPGQVSPPLIASTYPHQQLSNNNHANSPLLQLPPEIRTMIYRLVLCDKNIHIHQCWHYAAPKGKIHSRVCIASATDEQLVSTLRNAEGNKGETDFYAERHEACGPTGVYGCESTFSLTLLYVCRQIYSEAKDMPFALNTFSFHTDTDIRGFVESLTCNRHGEKPTSQMRSIILGERAYYALNLNRRFFQNLARITIFDTFNAGGQSPRTTKTTIKMRTAIDIDGEEDHPSVHDGQLDMYQPVSTTGPSLKKVKTISLCTTPTLHPFTHPAFNYDRQRMLEELNFVV